MTITFDLDKPVDRVLIGRLDLEIEHWQLEEYVDMVRDGFDPKVEEMPSVHVATELLNARINELYSLMAEAGLS